MDYNKLNQGMTVIADGSPAVVYQVKQINIIMVSMELDLLDIYIYF